MNETTKKLTGAQKEFAAENHGLVFDFLKSKGLDDDFYDVVIFRFLRALGAKLKGICF